MTIFGCWPPSSGGASNSDDVTNLSSVVGANVTQALNTLLASLALKSARNPIWDAPTVASPFDDEFTTDVLASGTSGWNLNQTGSLGTPMIRDGEINLTQPILTGHFRSSCIGSTLYLQLRQGEEVFMWKTLPSIPTSNRLWFAGVGFMNENNANIIDPRVSLQITKNNGGLPSFADRAFIRTASNPDRYEGLTVTGGATIMNVATNAFLLMPQQGLALRINHGSAAAGNVGCYSFNSTGTIGTVLSGSGQQFNAADQKIVFNLVSSPTQPPVTNINAVIFALHFLRSVDLTAGGWLAQP